jgi:hypothetical protein
MTFLFSLPRKADATLAVEIELLRRGDGDAADDGDQAENLGQRDLLAIEHEADDDREDGLARLDNLPERDGSGRHGVDGARVRHRGP